MRRPLLWLLWTLLVVAVVAAVIVGAGILLHLGPYHPPINGGYWGGI